MTYHLGAYYFEDPDGTFVSQPRKYIDKLADTYRRLFNDDPPKCYSNNGGEYQWKRVEQVIGSHCNNATVQQ